jgi:hypothetical protein
VFLLLVAFPSFGEECESTCTVALGAIETVVQSWIRVKVP